ncbi:hypothetical protein [Alkalibacter mobilis]|uniref:hypothetical protein n=1 Tax=Alkalibacter mobilis TaxID=2787712 RepID=UPI00189D63A6|nr:hypothetical protein [Alkalibacter mobilis]MBF7097199.1 hypothetical protein [Alkalibacter mobilis]
MSLIKKVQIGIHFFVGLGALFGGYTAISDPTGKSIGLDAEVALRYGPFDDFLIPGLFLFVIIGLGNLFVGYLGIGKSRLFSFASFAQGAVLVSWIVIQCLILADVNVLHGIFFVIGGGMVFFGAKEMLSKK